MNLSTKIYKFKKAIWEYRGKYDPTTKVWSKLPSKKAKARVIKGLERLGLEIESSLTFIDGLKNRMEFDAWITLIAETKRNGDTYVQPKRKADDSRETGKDSVRSKAPRNAKRKANIPSKD